MYGTHYVKMDGVTNLVTIEHAIRNGTWGIKWSRDWLRHVTAKLKVMASIPVCIGWGRLCQKRPEIAYTLSYDFAWSWMSSQEVKVIRIYSDGNILKSVSYSIGQTPSSLNAILFFIFNQHKQPVQLFLRLFRIIRLFVLFQTECAIGRSIWPSKWIY